MTGPSVVEWAQAGMQRAPPEGMTLLPTVLSVAGGLLLVGLALRDMFDTLVRPRSRGTVGWLVERGIWRLLHAMPPQTLLLAGSLIFVGTVGVWVALLAFGGAFLYWPMLPDGFRIAPELRLEDVGSFTNAVYLSLVTLATLGFGDLTPTADWLKIVVPLQAVIGFVLLSAAISWLVSLFPAVRQQWALARRISMALDAFPDALPGSLVESLTREVVDIRVVFQQFPTAYYFRAHDERAELPLALLRLHSRLPETGEVDQAGKPEPMLRLAIEDLSAYLGERFLGHDGPLGSTLRRYAADHGHQGLEQIA